MLLDESISLMSNPMGLDADKRQAWVTMVSCQMGLDADRSRGPVPKARRSSTGLSRRHVEARRLKPSRSLVPKLSLCQRLRYCRSLVPKLSHCRRLRYCRSLVICKKMGRSVAKRFKHCRSLDIRKRWAETSKLRLKLGQRSKAES